MFCYTCYTLLHTAKPNTPAFRRARGRGLYRMAVSGIARVHTIRPSSNDTQPA